MNSQENIFKGLPFNVDTILENRKHENEKCTNCNHSRMIHHKFCLKRFEDGSYCHCKKFSIRI